MEGKIGETESTDVLSILLEVSHSWSFIGYNFWQRKAKQSQFTLPSNKQGFTTPLGVTHVTLNSILENWGSAVNSNDGYSQVFCMSCARSLVRTFATQTKQVQNISKSPPGIAIKRFSSGSPSAGGSPLALLERKIKVANPESHWQCTSWFKSISTTSGSIRSKFIWKKMYQQDRQSVPPANLSRILWHLVWLN